MTWFFLILICLAFIVWYGNSRKEDAQHNELEENKKRACEYENQQFINRMLEKERKEKERNRINEIELAKIKAISNSTFRDEYKRSSTVFQSYFWEPVTTAVFFDLETNGLSPKYSVLSCSALKCRLDFDSKQITILERFNRFYYPRENYERNAIEVNGLNEHEITRRRSNAQYPRHFIHDQDFERFCIGIDYFVAHNIDFDSRFVPFLKHKKHYCTMKENTGVVPTPFLKWKKEYKWPTLEETALHYNVHFNKNSLHNSMTDIEIVVQVFEKMMHRNHFR